MVREVRIQGVSEEDIPNRQWDDWRYDDEGVLKIYVADHLSEATYWRIVIHALVEALLCRHHGVPAKTVDDWDKDFTSKQVAGHYDQMEEPGEHPRCPYRHEHAAAMMLDILFYKEWIKTIQ